MQYKHFSVEEREVIQRGLWEKKPVSTIAKEIGRHPTSVAREINRNLPPERERYTPRLANEKALAKRRSRGRTDRKRQQRLPAFDQERRIRWNRSPPGPLRRPTKQTNLYLLGK